MKPKILSYGEIIFDLIEGRPFLGGAPLNFAWFVNQLGGQEDRARTLTLWRASVAPLAKAS